MKRLLAFWAVAVVVASALCSVAEADVFILANGGRVVGELVNPSQVPPRATYTIETPAGCRVTLSRSQVKERLRPRPAEIEYEKTRPRYPDTVEGQWALAEWCRENTLLAERKIHLERILELAPDHEKARRALGYFLRDGEWTTEEQTRKKDGYIRYKGRWRLPQEKKLAEEQAATKAAQGEWKQKLNRWQEWLATNKAPLACENIRKIDDPSAIPALADALKKDSRDQARMLFIEALARIGTPVAVRVVSVQALEDPIEEVRLTCLDYLKQVKGREAADYFIRRLRSADNVEVNRAAVGLRCLDDRSAIGPLVDALITVHKFKVSSGNPGQMSTTFGTGAGGAPGGLSVGGGPKIITRTLTNQAVLDALISLTDGVNYSFDVGRWKAWYAAQKKHQGVDARRD